jgi:hypothetical protein
MNTGVINQKQPVSTMNNTACPYNGFNVCMASFSSMLLDSRKREICCSTENYDDCPIFLSKVLRRR